MCISLALTLVSAVQPPNAKLPTEFTQLSKVTSFKLMQFKKASSPMVVTELGMTTSVRP